MRVRELRCEGRADPIGIGNVRPRLSWILDDERPGARSTAFQILAARASAALSEERGDLWDSGRVASDECAVLYAGEPLPSQRRCHWMVRVWDQEGKPSAWSEPGIYSIGLIRRSDWSGTFIGYARAECPLLRRVFHISEPCERATLHGAALGLCELRLNGAPASEDQLVPGYVDYEAFIPCRAWDVTRLIERGPNVLAATLAPGFYAGSHGIGARRKKRPVALCAELEIEHPDGARTIIATDPSWRARAGPLLSADLLHGERYDARLEVPGWDAKGTDDGGWDEVDLHAWPSAPLRPHPGPPVRRFADFPAQPLASPRRESCIFDLGQNIAGRVRLRVAAARGTEIGLRHAEVLTERGDLYVENLRKARATDSYIARGDGVEVYEPRFTSHGFRYVEVTGRPALPAIDEITGVAVGTEMAIAGDFECDSPRIERLHRAIRETLRANAIEVPTDCPQRDERLGWTGDAQLAARSLLYHFAAAPFLVKWLQDLVDAQAADGAFPDVAPPDPSIPWGTVGWADAPIFVTRLVHLFTGDVMVLKGHYGRCRRFMEYLLARHADLVPECRYGDWLAPSGPETPKALIGAALYAADARGMREMASYLGLHEDEARWRALHIRIRDAFQNRFLRGGRLRVETQTGLALALVHDLIEGDERAAAAGRLRDLVERQGLATGFVGTACLFPALAGAGHIETAYALLESEAYPSYGYMLAQGATTLWERWDSYVPERGFQDPSMNSFNHAALCSVGAFLFATVGGIEPLAPGFRRIRFDPRPGGSLTHARVRHRSARGDIACEWWREAGKLRIEVVVPPGSDAELYLPSGDRVELRPGKSVIP